MSTVLEVRDLTKSFGGIHAVERRVVRRATKARSSASSGRTARGKSTLFNCILGQLAPTRGRGAPRRARRSPACAPCDLNRLGVGRTFQLLQVFPNSRCART